MKGVKDALSRLSGVKTITVKLQEGIIVANTDPLRPVLPALFWKEVARVGFVPVRLEMWATGHLEEKAFAIGHARWPLVKPGSAEGHSRRIHLKVADASEDPPRVEVAEESWN